MSQFYYEKPSFSLGEVSPYFRGRSDLEKRESGLEVCEGMIAQPQGGIIRHMGTHHITPILANAKTRSESFTFSDDTYYLLLFSDLLLHIYKNDSLLTFITTVYTETDLDSLYFAQQGDVLTVTHLRGTIAPYKITRTATDTFSYTVFPYNDGPYNYWDSTDTWLRLGAVTYTANLRALTAAYWTGVPVVANDYVDYHKGGELYLAKVLVTPTTDTASIEPIDNVVVDIDPKTELTFNAAEGLVEATTSIFTTALEGSYIKVGASWYLINKYLGLRDRWELGETISDYKDMDANGTYEIKTAATGAPPLGIEIDSAPQFENNVSYRFTADGTLVNDYNANHYQQAFFDNGGELYVRYKRQIDVCTATLLAPFQVVDNTECTYENEVITSTLATSSAFFVPNDVGRWVRLDLGGEQIPCKIDSQSSVTANVTLSRYPPYADKDKTKFLQDGLTQKWRWGQWYTGNYPFVSSYHQERQFFGGNPDNPDVYSYSKKYEYEKFSPSANNGEVLDNFGGAERLLSSTLDRIVWMESFGYLVVGTSRRVYSILGKATDNLITPANITSKTESDFGSADFIDGGIPVAPLRIGSSVLFIGKGGTKLYQLSYNENTQIAAREISILSEHIYREGGFVKQLAYKREGVPSIWAVRNDGQLAVVTYLKDQEFFSWSRYRIAGTEGKAESIASRADGRLYVVTNRQINGAVEIRTLEKMADNFIPLESKGYIPSCGTTAVPNSFYPSDPINTSRMVYMQGTLTYTSFDVATLLASGISSLAWLLNETITIVVDGDFRGDYTVSSTGTITGWDTILISCMQDNPTYYPTIMIGYRFSSTMKFLAHGGKTVIGTTRGIPKKLKSAFAEVLWTNFLKTGDDPLLLDDVEIKEGVGITDIAPPLLSKDYEFSIRNTLGSRVPIYIESDSVFPLNINLLIFQFEFSFS